MQTWLDQHPTQAGVPIDLSSARRNTGDHQKKQPRSLRRALERFLRLKPRLVWVREEVRPSFNKSPGDAHRSRWFLIISRTGRLKHDIWTNSSVRVQHLCILAYNQPSLTAVKPCQFFGSSIAPSKPSYPACEPFRLPRPAAIRCKLNVNPGHVFKQVSLHLGIVFLQHPGDGPRCLAGQPPPPTKGTTTTL
jgi:hypothetical protein